MKLNEIGELGFIERIKQGCILRPGSVIKGIGDDCSVIRSNGGKAMLLTADMLLEEVHFKRSIIPPYKLGRKALAVNISDIAAMGGIPGEALVSIAIPRDIDIEYLDGIYDGLKSMATEHGVNIIGGDTTLSPKHLVINIALIGEAKENEVLYRSAAEVGDIIFVTGYLGSAAAGLDILLNRGKIDNYAELVEAQLNPSPHMKEGLLLAESGKVNSLIDVSDGLASDLGHICRESGVGAIIHENQIPVKDSFREYLKEFVLDFEKLALHVGEDYVLLGTMRESEFDSLHRLFIKSGLQLYRIGEIVPGGGIKMKSDSGDLRDIIPAGYDHFKRAN